MKLICLGDSITRGQVSVDYVAMLRDRLPGTDVINAGVNHEPSSKLLDRLDDVIARDPDVVTVLIGTNDANATLSEPRARALRKRWKLRETPTAAGYAANLAAVAKRLQDETMARVALLSPPVIGEDLDSLPVRRSAEFAAIARKVAADQGVTYLPLNERMTADLAGTTPGTRYRPDSRQARTAAIQHFLLGRGLDAIS
ncbi:MAG: SGNH/GDSL hydrolase family protein, partial [Nonomuraea sp.]|nr:SGNH/GDSL hydrolase family protein [Nonomuraea sp.]